jgi:hypothetical protein
MQYYLDRAALVTLTRTRKVPGGISQYSWKEIAVVTTNDTLKLAAHKTALSQTKSDNINRLPHYRE